MPPRRTNHTARQAKIRTQSDWLSTGYSDRQHRDSAARTCRSGRWRSAFSTSISLSNAVLNRRGNVFGQDDRQFAKLGIEIGAHLTAKRVFRLLQPEARLADQNLGIGVLRLRLVDFELRDRAELEFALRALQRFDRPARATAPAPAGSRERKSTSQ